jgi:hypothetical protein
MGSKRGSVGGQNLGPATRSGTTRPYSQRMGAGRTVEPRYKNIIGPAHRILIEEVFLYKGN